MAATPTIIKNIIKYLKEENIYTEKDKMALMLLQTTYEQYLQAVKEVEERGQVIVVLDFNKNKKIIINPSFNNQMQLQKELFKLIDSLYLTPKSRKTKKEENEVEENPFAQMLREISNIKTKGKEGE